MVTFTRILLILTFILAGQPAYSNSITNEAVFSARAKQEKLDVVHINEEFPDNLSKKEREWYKKFQEGLMFFSGWKQISQEILTAIPPEKKPSTRKLLQGMGVRIGTEWSKDNSIRKIDTDQLRTWGCRLKKAKTEGAENLAETVKTISTEVDALLDQDPNSRQNRNS